MVYRYWIRRTALVVGPILLTLATGVAPVVAAGPRVLMVYGPPLAKPIILHHWGENMQLMGAAVDAATVTRAKLKGRPYLHMALFWGSTWVQYVNQGKPLAALRPEQANQCTQFYPAYGTASPLMVFDSIPGSYTSLIHRVRPEGIAILARHGIPVRLKVGMKPIPPNDARCVGTLDPNGSRGR